MRTEDIEYLVLGGGGVRGAAYASALDELNRLLRFDFSKRLKGCAGTSIGSLYAAAVAYGMRTEDMLNIARETSLIDLVSPHVSNLFSHRGLDLGSTVISWIDTHIGSRMITFGEFYETTHIDLRVFVTNLNTCESECLSHASHPDLPVAKGVFTSMCLPPLFAPVEMNGSVYVDGGIMNNFPVSCFSSPEKTIGMTVQWGLCNSLNSFESYFSRLTYCTLSAGERSLLRALPEEYMNRTMRIDCGDVSTLNWRVPANQARAMELRGRETVRKFVLEHNLRALPIRRSATSVSLSSSSPLMVSEGTQTEIAEDQEE